MKLKDMIIRTINKFKMITESFGHFGQDPISVEYFRYQGKNRTFVAEIAELHSADADYVPGQKIITLKNFKTGIEMKFDWYKTDKDGSNEDTYGWRYVNKEKNIFVLIVND